MRTPTDLHAGSELLGYRIERVLGRGGMGVVYLAHQTALDRMVALKLLAPALAADDRFRERFLRESRLAASLDHPNIVPVFDAGETDGRLYIAMRYVEGSDLRELFDREGVLTPEQALALLLPVADALDTAHAKGLVHRDVKPSNILIDEAGRPYLADFGLTRTSAEPGQAEAFMGSADYAAPEQIEGRPVGSSADQYALACVLYECLTGQAPFHAGSLMTVLWGHVNDPIPAASEANQQLPEAIDGVLAKALAKEPEERHASCRELVAAAAKALGIGGPARSWLRLPVLLALAGLVLIATAAAAYFAVRVGGDLPVSGDTLVRIDPRTNRVAATIPVGKSPSAVAVGASGLWVANRGNATVSRIDPDTNEVKLQVTAHGAPADLTISSRHVIVANGPGEAGIAVIDAATGIEEDLFSLASGSFFGSPSIAAGESGIWVATGDRRVARLDITNGTLVDPVVIPQPGDERADTAFSAIAVGEDGVWVIGDPLDRSLWRIDPSTGELVATISLPFAPKDVAAGTGGVWVTSQLDDTLSRIDTATNMIATTIPVGRGAAGVAVGAGSVWVANAVAGTVSRVDPRTHGVRTIDVDGYPEDVAVGEDAVWVTASG